MEKNTTTFETGATSAAVNELILYTDNTRELAELRDKIYATYQGSEKPDAWDMQTLVFAAQENYRACIGPKMHIRFMKTAQRQEYCQIYANRFAEWKRERERNDKLK